MVEKERTYIIPLRKEFLKVPLYRRTRKSVTAIRQFVSKHMKVDGVKIGRYLNLELWKHGRKNPPGKIKVKTYVDEKDNEKFAKVELFGAPEEVKKEEAKKGVGEKIKEAIGGKKGEKKEEEKKPEGKKQENLEDIKVKEEKKVEKGKEERNIRKSDQETSGPK